MPSITNEFLSTLPTSPGVYQYFDEAGKLLYVGKAKNLKKRVSSYFQKTRQSSKTEVLVRKVRDVKTIVTHTELDALLLENNLIKKHQPRYNVQLRDDKTYPWIIIRNEAFPRVHATRNPEKGKGEYHGPYASVKSMHALLNLAKKLYPLRSCSYNLTQENIEAGKFRACLEYHIGNCMAPCIGEQSEEDYDSSIAEIRRIIRGDYNGVRKTFEERIAKHSAALEFERAQRIKERLEALDRYQARSSVMSSRLGNVDVISSVSDDKYVYVNYLQIIKGSLIHSHTVEVKQNLNELDELLGIVLIEMRNRFSSKAQSALIPMELDLPGLDLELHVPQKGEKKRVLDLSERNARQFMMEKHKSEKIKDPSRHSERILNTLQKDLRLKDQPRHIECFDNSNFQGSHPVAACVVFKDAKPSKKDYRHFNIRTVEGPDDFASMEEVVQRRYKRLLDEGESLPDLIVIDGGKGQLNAALKALERLGIRGQIAIVGIAKKLEEIFFPDDPVPLHIDKRSESLKVIQHLRNEAHRFGITHHRKKRSKSAIQSGITDIPGIGPKSAAALTRKFKSLKRMKDAPLKEIIEVLGEKKGKQLYDHLKRSDQ